MHLPANPTKYEIEDDLDFFAALKSIQPPSQDHHLDTDDEHENTCLITNDPLNAFHVTLVCGHKFNYEPLYQEVLRQKGRLGMHNYYERIGMHQIKCPYCRTFTNQLLPYIGPHPTIKRLNGVNSPASMCMPGVACSHNAGCGCGATAFYEHNSNPYCLRHAKSASKLKSTKPKSKPKDEPQCAAEIQTGKNKGQQCSLIAVQSDSALPLCKKHSKCNVVMYAQVV
jgi:hypothetical protein